MDLAKTSVSLAVREMCCRIGIDSGSFTRAAGALERVGQLKLGEELLRQIVESEGKGAVAGRGRGQRKLDFDAGACLTDADRRRRAGAPGVGGDRWIHDPEGQ